MFAYYFSMVYSHHIFSTNKLSLSDTHIPQLDIIISDIFTKLSSLDANKCPGPDGVPTLFLKTCSFNFSRLLYRSKTTGKRAF